MTEKKSTGAEQAVLIHLCWRGFGLGRLGLTTTPSRRKDWLGTSALEQWFWDCRGSQKRYL